MKKTFSFFCALLLGITLVGCSSSPYYIKEKIMAGTTYNEFLEIYKRNYSFIIYEPRLL